MNDGKCKGQNAKLSMESVNRLFERGSHTPRTSR